MQTRNIRRREKKKNPKIGLCNNKINKKTHLKIKTKTITQISKEIKQKIYNWPNSNNLAIEPKYQDKRQRQNNKKKQVWKKRKSKRQRNKTKEGSKWSESKKEIDRTEKLIKHYYYRVTDIDKIRYGGPWKSPKSFVRHRLLDRSPRRCYPS